MWKKWIFKFYNKFNSSFYTHLWFISWWALRNPVKKLASSKFRLRCSNKNELTELLEIHLSYLFGSKPWRCRWRYNFRLLLSLLPIHGVRSSHRLARYHVKFVKGTIVYNWRVETNWFTLMTLRLTNTIKWCLINYKSSLSKRLLTKLKYKANLF